MRSTWLAWSMFVIAGAIPAAHSAEVCKPHLLAEVELQITPDGKVYLPVMVNGHDVYFLLDMASGIPYVLDSAMQELGLTASNRGGDGEIHAEGRPVTKYTKLDDLRIGDFQLASRNALITTPPPGFTPTTIAGKPLVGIMGSSLIRNLDAELSLAEHKFRMFTPIACRGGTPVYWGGEAVALPMHWDEASTPVFILEVNGQRIEASLLARDGVTTIDANAARDFFGIDIAGGDEQAFHPMSLSGHGIEIRDAAVRLRTGGCKLTRSTPIYRAIGYARCVNTVPFNLGTDLLRQMRIYISKKQETVFVTRVTPTH